MREMPLRSLALKVMVALRAKLAPLASTLPPAATAASCGPSRSGWTGARDRVTARLSSALRPASSSATTRKLWLPSVLASVFQP